MSGEKGFTSVRKMPGKVPSFITVNRFIMKVILLGREI